MKLKNNENTKQNLAQYLRLNVFPFEWKFSISKLRANIYCAIPLFPTLCELEFKICNNKK